MDALNYYIRGKKSFEEGDYKVAMVLLRRTGLNSHDTVELYANSAYEAWRSPLCKITPEEVKEAYALLLRTVEPSIISPFQFVRLAQIYICYGSLEGALKIMILAADAGNLDECMILVQTWTLMRKLCTASEAREYMDAITDTVTMQLFDPQPDEDEYLYLKGTDLPLYSIYLHCAFHMKRDIMENNYKFKYEKENALKKYSAIISEAYTFYFRRHPRNCHIANAWFESKEMWMEMGTYLETSSCPLLAEESYWICFVNFPLSEDPIKATLELMKNTNRSQEEFKFLEKAYWNNSWNVFVRTQLMERESGDIYKTRFKGDISAAQKIQASYRGYHTRKHWEHVYEDTQIAREEFVQIVDKGKKMREKNIFKNNQRRLYQWRDNVKALKRLKQKCALMVQMSWRCHIAKEKRKNIILKMRNANKKYFFACEFHHNMYRLQIIREWTRLMRITRFNRCARILAQFITTSERRKKFYWAADKLRRLLGSNRRHRCKVIMRRWYALFSHRRKLHAVACIRFFVRNILVGLRNRKKNAEIAVITSNKAMTETKQRLDSHTLREKFAKWRSLYLARQTKIATDILSRKLPIMLARRKDRKKVQQLRIRRELLISKAKGRLYRQYNDSFSIWWMLTAVCHVQRFVRMFLARRELFRRKRRNRAVVAHGAMRAFKLKRHVVVEWRHFVTRCKFCQKVARRKIVKWIIKRMFLRKLLRTLSRQLGLSKFLLLIDGKYKRKCFGQLHRMVFGLKKYLLLKKMCGIFTQTYTSRKFRILKDVIKAQRKISGLERILVENALNRRAAALSSKEEWIFKSITGYMGGSIQIVSSKSGAIVDSHRWPLLNVTRRTVQLDSTTLQTIKAFQCWAHVFRWQQMRKVKNRAEYSPHVVNQALSLFHDKQKSAIIIQTRIRVVLANCIKRNRRLAKLRFWENAVKLRGLTKHRLHLRHFHEMLFLAVHSKGARLTLQCWFRQCIARRKLLHKKVLLGILQNKESKVYKLHRKYCLSRIMRLLEFGCVLRCCELQLSTPMERRLLDGGTKAVKTFEQCRDRSRLRTKLSDVRDFCSEEYHSHYFKLKQTGILVMDASATSNLKANERVYLIENSHTLFSQADSFHEAIRDIASHFFGQKLIFCGGMIGEESANDLYYLITSREESIRIHFSEVKMKFKVVARMCRALEHNFAKLRELSVDSQSVGSLGIAALLTSLKINMTVETFSIKIDSINCLLSCHEECVKTLVQNSYLRELRFFGAPITSGMIKGLIYALSYGLSRLALLEFDFETPEKQTVDMLVDIGKSREKKRTGSNTFVNATEYWSC